MDRKAADPVHHRLLSHVELDLRPKRLQLAGERQVLSGGDQHRA